MEHIENWYLIILPHQLSHAMIFMDNGRSYYRYIGWTIDEICKKHTLLLIFGYIYIVYIYMYMRIWFLINHPWKLFIINDLWIYDGNIIHLQCTAAQGQGFGWGVADGCWECWSAALWTGNRWRWINTVTDGLGIYERFIWDLHGMYMNYTGFIWDLYAIYMGFIWDFGFNMGFIWDLYDI